MPDNRTEYEQRRDLALSRLTEGDRDNFEERAGIMQFCGGLTRVKAECAAFRIIKRTK